MRTYLFLLFFAIVPLSAMEPIALLKKAEPESWLLLRQGKNYLLLHTLAKTETQLTLEEIITSSIPKEGVRSLRQNAAPIVSWLIHTIDLESGHFIRTYSWQNQCDATVPERDNFIATLLHLSFEKIPLEERRRIGPAPSKGETDRRKIWEPKMVFEGKKIAGIAFDGWKAKWPQDCSELSNKLVLLYTAPEGGEWPTYFPYWIEVSGFLGQAKVQVIDSGAHLR